MKAAMIEAPLGDEKKGEDPTTRHLEEKVAGLLGQEAALFFPSATMANEVAIRLLCEPGEELLAAENCHLFVAEAGGPAVHAGVMARPIPTKTGFFTVEALRENFRWSKGPHYPISKLVSIENTTNMGGGLAWNPDTLNAILDEAENLDLKTHLDGSRLFNASIKTNTNVATLASRFDAVTLCLSKGLGCPVGAVLAFKSQHYTKVRRLKQLFGGSLRQSGMLAVAGLYALDHHVSRLVLDHEHAALLAQGLQHLNHFIQVETHPAATNMVFFYWHANHLTPAEFNEACLRKGVRFSQVGPNRFRAVTHLNINRADIEKALAILQEIASGLG